MFCSTTTMLELSCDIDPIISLAFCIRKKVMLSASLWYPGSVFSCFVLDIKNVSC